MDITLTRILSLIPRKDNGDFVHGELKIFANSIGLKSGNLVSDWINGRSKSYRNYLYEIAAKYNVSVEWLKGETDEKIPHDARNGETKNTAPKNEGGLSATQYYDLNPENQALVDCLIEKLLKSQSDE